MLLKVKNKTLGTTAVAVELTWANWSEICEFMDRFPDHKLVGRYLHKDGFIYEHDDGRGKIGALLAFEGKLVGLVEGDYLVETNFRGQTPGIAIYSGIRARQDLESDYEILPIEVPSELKTGPSPEDRNRARHRLRGRLEECDRDLGSLRDRFRAKEEYRRNLERMIEEMGAEE